MVKFFLPASLSVCAAVLVPVTIPAPRDTWIESTVAYVSTRHDPSGHPLLAAEIYLMNMETWQDRRLTVNAVGDALPAISPDGKKIAFDSNELRADGPINTSDLFVVDADGSDRRWVIRGSSTTWSPDSRFIAFHASASGTGLPIKLDPGAATADSDIFIVNLDDVLLIDDVLQRNAWRMNLTNDSDAIDDDPDWSPDGLQIAFTSHDVNDSHTNSVTAEIYVRNADGSGVRERLTYNGYEERAVDWSNDGTRMVFMCRIGGSDFEICVMNANGSGLLQLTDNTTFDGTPAWSPDDGKIAFARQIAPGRQQLFWMNADGTAQEPLTAAAGTNLMPNWGHVVRHGMSTLGLVFLCSPRGGEAPRLALCQ